MAERAAQGFQSTLPLRGATGDYVPQNVGQQFQSTLPLRGATVFPGQKMINKEFQSTLPLRGATCMILCAVMWHPFQSTLPLRGATPILRQHMTKVKFQSTLPLRGATNTAKDRMPKIAISIHAPLTGSDSRRHYRKASNGNFNPRSPYGERQYVKGLLVYLALFQSTLPLRGATSGDQKDQQKTDISIHAPLTGSDSGCLRQARTGKDFNPRSPYGERQQNLLPRQGT